MQLEQQLSTHARPTLAMRPIDPALCRDQHTAVPAAYTLGLRLRYLI